MRTRILLVSSQIPAMFCAGAAWSSQLDQAVVVMFAVAIVALAMYMHYMWAASLVELGYAAGRIDGYAEVDDD